MTTEKKDNIAANVEGLATLLVLQDQVKKLKNLKEFGYFVTNETHRLLHFNTAFLWQKWELFDLHLLAQSEIGEVDQQTPTNQWVKSLIKELLSQKTAMQIQALSFEKPSDTESKGTDSSVVLSKELLTAWPEILPKYIIWSPFLDVADEISGGLILFRDHEFTEQETRMFGWLASNYQYTWQFFTKSKMIMFRKLFRKRNNLIIGSIILLAFLLFPIRLSVVSSATVGAKDPALINAPIAGIIKEFLVKPGDVVKKDQLLVILDKKDIQNSLEVNQKKLLLTEAKLRSANTQGYDKAETRSEIPLLEADAAINKAEIDYTKTILGKTDIVSPIDGIVVFDSKEDWVGQPVQAGENIMTIANPSHVELKIALPISELIDLEVGSPGKFYVYGQFSEVPVRLIALGYNARLMPNKTLAYPFVADFVDPKTIPRLGSQGTVRLYGHYVPMVYYLFRRPFQAVRQFLGI
jgi:multidrug resistance efflux pump